MKIKQTLFIIFSSTLFLLGIWIVILFNIDPSNSDFLTYFAFLASLFLWLSGAITIIEFFIRFRLSKHELLYTHLPVSTRHGLLIAFTISILLALQLIRVLNAFDAILIIVIIALFELYFRARSNVNIKPETN